MSDWAFIEGARLVSQCHDAANSRGLSIATAQNSKPTPTQVVASTAFDAVGILVEVCDLTTATTCLIDIMAGAASSEWVILPDLLASVATGAEAHVSYFFPIFIPKATRLSARGSGSGASTTCRINVHLLQGSYGSAPFNKVTAYGVDSANSRGTIIDPGGTANTKPALPATQIVASTTYPIRMMTVAIGDGGIYVRTPSATSLLDINAGASSSEYSLIDNLAISYGTSKDQYGPMIVVPNVPLYVPVGTRLSARMQCTSIDATERASDVIIYGVS